jgi:hypothetical protein
LDGEDQQGSYQDPADPNLLPPILAAYGANYGSDFDSFFDDPKVDEGDLDLDSENFFAAEGSSDVSAHRAKPYAVALRPKGDDNDGLEAII